MMHQATLQGVPPGRSLRRLGNQSDLEKSAQTGAARWPEAAFGFLGLGFTSMIMSSLIVNTMTTCVASLKLRNVYGNSTSPKPSSKEDGQQTRTVCTHNHAVL